MEKLMQYIWNHRLFDMSGLKTTDGRRVQIIDTGRWNSDSGPDFFNAKIRVDGCIWAGNVEIHRRASDWKKHNHHLDRSYDSVILHVVEFDDMQIARSDGEIIPQLILRCSPDFRKDYEYLVNHTGSLPCGERLYTLDKLFITDWMNALAMERLQDKTGRIFIWLDQYKGNWEEVCYVTLSRNMGFSINSDTFERLSRSLPLIFLLKHADSLLQIEAFLFGQAGLLVPGQYPDDTYYNVLLNEYIFLKNKFGLASINADSWKFSRLRPANFPHRRIAMLAQMVYDGFSLFAKLCEAKSEEELRSLFSVRLTGYWCDHYTFGQSSPEGNMALGSSAVDIVLINTVVPLLYAYGIKTGNDEYLERSMSILESLKSEQNNIVRKFAGAGISLRTALDSQAVIQLNNAYCLQKKCLYCRIGHKLLAKAAVRNQEE